MSGQFVLWGLSGLNSIQLDKRGNPMIINGDPDKYKVFFGEVKENLAKSRSDANEIGTIVQDTGRAIETAREQEGEYRLNLGRAAIAKFKRDFDEAYGRPFDPKIDKIFIMSHSAGAFLLDCIIHAADVDKETIFIDTVVRNVLYEPFTSSTAIEYDEHDENGYRETPDYTIPGYGLTGRDNVGLKEFKQALIEAFKTEPLFVRGGSGYNSVAKQFEDAEFIGEEHVLPNSRHGLGLTGSYVPEEMRTFANGYFRGDAVMHFVSQVLQPFVKFKNNQWSLWQYSQQSLQDLTERALGNPRAAILFAGAGAALLTAWMSSGERNPNIASVGDISMSGPKPGL